MSLNKYPIRTYLSSVKTTFLKAPQLIFVPHQYAYKDTISPVSTITISPTRTSNTEIWCCWPSLNTFISLSFFLSLSFANCFCFCKSFTELTVTTIITAMRIATPSIHPNDCREKVSTQVPRRLITLTMHIPDLQKSKVARPGQQISQQHRLVTTLLCLSRHQAQVKRNFPFAVLAEHLSHI